MKLQSLRMLIAIDELGSFSEAALELGTSQSVVSHAIAELEAELGVRLLDRGRFGAVPTEVGRRVVAHARTLHGVVGAIRQEAALELGSLRGTLRISAFRSVATRVLPGAIARLTERYPELEVAVEETSSRYADPVGALRAGTVDVALTMSVLAEGAIFWELLRDPYVVVVPETFRHADRRISLVHVLEHPVVLGDGPCSWPLRERLAACAPAFAPTFEISEDSTILGMVAQGLGVAVMPELTLDAIPPGVRRIDLDESVHRQVGVALLPGTLKIPAARAFLNTLRALFPQGDVPRLGESLVPA